ncbi:MAG: endonuclease/exonuclease/phosphatase family protein [Bacteroidales bacterium]|nr:endonuclease/exonuclease/phosphatase family protein [Bacteroidales bacterium]
MSSSKLSALLSVCLSLGLLSACGGKVDEPIKKENETTDLLVCTFNIRYPEPSDGDYIWDNRKDAVCNFILTRKPDIIGMQEVERVQSEYILSKVKDEYGLYGIGRESGKDILQVSGDETSNTILYKKSRFDLVSKGTFWHSDTPNQVAAKNKANDYGSWHTSHPLCTSWLKLADGDNLGRTVWLFNTHYQNNKNMTAVAPGLRMMESNLHISMIPSITGSSLGNGCKDPVFLIGDFNSAFTTDELQQLRNVPLGYAREDAAKSSFRTANTDNGYGKGGALIDHMFFCGPLKSLSYTVDKRDYGILYISDHYPVLSEFSYTDK